MLERRQPRATKSVFDARELRYRGSSSHKRTFTLDVRTTGNMITALKFLSGFRYVVLSDGEESAKYRTQQKLYRSLKKI